MCASTKSLIKKERKSILLDKCGAYVFACKFPKITIPGVWWVGVTVIYNFFFRHFSINNIYRLIDIFIACRAHGTPN